MYCWKLYCIQRLYPGMNCVSLVMLLFVRQMKTIYLLKLDNQAVDKKNTEDSPCANVNYINLCILCYDSLDLPGRPKTSKVRRRWAKDGNDQKTAWRLPRFTDLYQDSIYFEWLVSSWSKSAHYHGNLISKSCRSRVTHLYNRKSRIKWWCPIPRHADNLGSVTRHPANFGAITRHAKTLCHPHLIWRNVWDDLDSMVFGYPFASFQLWTCLNINTIVSFSMGQVHWIFLKFCYRATQRSNETVDGLE